MIASETPTKRRPKPIFIADQIIERFVLPVEERGKLREYLLGGRELRQRNEDGELQAVSPWSSEKSRWDLLSDPMIRLLCISTDAGHGKTQAASQAQVLRQSHSGDLVIRVDLKALPNQAYQFLDDGDDSVLVRHLDQHFLEMENHRKLRGRRPKLHDLSSVIRMSIKRSQFSLIVDGLDQINLQDGRTTTTALRHFLHSYPGARSIVAGRTAAIHDFWNELFNRRDNIHAESASLDSEWEFARVTLFDETQRERFIGKVRYDHLKRIQANELFLPRFLAAMNTLFDERFFRVRTAAEVYWECLDQTMVEDFEKRRREMDTKLTREEFIDLLSLIAWCLMTWKPDGPDNAIAHFKKVDKSDSPDFLNYLFERRATLRHPKLNRNDVSIEKFEEYLHTVARINVSYVDFLFSSERGIESWNWRDPTLRDFFAALYVCRNHADVEWLANHQPIKTAWCRGEVVPALCRHLPYHGIWRHICEMPSTAWGEAEYQDSDRQLAAIATLYSRRNEKRPGEMMYRAWWNLMQRISPMRHLQTEEDVLRATRASHEVVSSGLCFQPVLGRRKSTQSGSLCHDNAAISSQAIVHSFLSEFLEMSSYGHANHGILREDMLDHFRWCEASAGVEFVCGHSDEVGNTEALRILEEGFELCSYQVTNRLYACFDEHHAEWFDREDVGYKYSNESPYARGPAIYVSWYDAMMLATWSHSRLPTEWEWEYACRANKKNAAGHNAMFYWGDDASKLERHAWIHSNSSEAENKRVKVFGNHAHTVGTRAPEHPFGLHDMLGNVLEWSSNRFGEGVSRACRGG